MSRLIEADYNNGSSVLNYGYDVAGNLVDFDGTTRTFNAANQMTNDGTNTLTYDNNGNLTDDGIAYTWDRANRLKAHNGHTYTYDGLGNRVQEIVADGLPKIYDYLNDVAGGLTKLLTETHNSDVTRYIHAPRGIHAMEQVSGDWLYYAQDGLGSVRGAIDDAGAVFKRSSFTPYGELADGTLAGTTGSVFGFTGEQTNASGQVFLRARYYEPQLGIFSALDPFEGKSCMPMSLNGYGYVHGNPVNMVDPSGAIALNIDMSGTSRLIRQMTQAMRSVLTLPFNPFIIKNINSGWCSGGDSVGKAGAGSRSLPSRELAPFYRRGGSDIQQGGSASTACLDANTSNEDKRFVGCCDEGRLSPSQRRDIGCAEETCRDVCAGWLLLPFTGLFAYSSCIQNCLGDIGRDRLTETSDAISIELYSFNTDYTEGSGIDGNKNRFAVFQPNHAFIVYRNGTSGKVYYGGVGGQRPANLSCAGSITADWQDINSNPGQYQTWLDEQAVGRGTGPYILLTGNEAYTRRTCLDTELANIQRQIQDEGIAYCPHGRNSNTVAFTLLRNCGIPADITALGTVWLPGSRNRQVFD